MPQQELQPQDLIVVTGAAQGIGRAVALRLASMKARLALWDIDEKRVGDTASMCRESGVEAQAYCVDVAKWKDVSEAAIRVDLDLGKPFGLISNAGIYPRSSILETEPSQWERVLQVNLQGAFHCARAIVPMMLGSGRGAVVTIASGRALQGAVRGAHYAASKAGIVSFTKSLALELAPNGLRANCVIPGVTETAQPLEELTIDALRSMGKKIPLGRIGQPEDVAGVVAFLLGQDASYITGQSIAVNGGSIMIP